MSTDQANAQTFEELKELHNLVILTLDTYWDF